MALPSGKTASLSLRGIASAAFLSSLALCLSGCALGTLTLSGPDKSAAKISGISGKVIGGEQPVAGATVTVYTVGTTGYGTGATAISGATTTSDIFGNFQIPAYTCPSSSALTYIVATGGNPGNGLIASVTSVNVSGAAGGYTDTFTAPNNFFVGESVVITGFSTFSYLNGTTQTITAVSGNGSAPNNSFSIADSSASNPGAGAYTDSGLASGSTAVNSAIRLVATTGTCSKASQLNLDLDEVYTAATAYAMAQYVNPTTGQIGSPSSAQAQIGIANAFSTVQLLVNYAGQAVASTPLSGAGATLTAVPESAKLNSIADILSSCVNSAGNTGTTSNCGVLLANAGAGTATDTFDAAVEMAQQPFNTAAKVANLYTLQTATAPFAGLSAAPTDWSLGIQYQDNVGTFFIKPQNIAVDGLGNVWVLSNNSGPGGLVQLSPNGTPLSNISSLYSYGPLTATFTGCTAPALTTPKTGTTSLITQNFQATASFGAAANNPSYNPRNLAIDPNNNVWFTQTSSTTSSVPCGSSSTVAAPANGNVFEVATGSSSGLPTGSTYSFATGKSAYGLASDATGNIFVGEQSASANFGMYEFPYNATPGNALLTPAAFPPDSGTAVPEYLAIDTSGNKWFTNDSTAGAYKLTGATASSCTNTPTSPSLCQPTGAAYTTLTLPTGSSTPLGIAEGTTGMWIANASGSNVALVPFASTSTSTAIGSSTYFTTPQLLAVDGAGNAWVANKAGPNATTGTTGGSVSEVSGTSGNALLSPPSTSATNPGYTHLGVTFPFGVAIDPSGNIWVANNQTFSAACPVTLTPTTNTCSSVFEIIGSATPVVTPIASYQTTGPTKP